MNISSKNSQIIPRTINQQKYVKCLQNPKVPILISIGPAGCGKTLLACNEGVSSLKLGTHKKLIITRPAQHVDEEYGFIPGDINNKMDPWMRPLYDSFRYHFSHSQIDRFKESGIIEIAPFAYMRGRTFSNSFIIADEMQNATINQTKMLLTRLGENSKLVVTGDLDQKDIQHSGLEHFLNLYHDNLEFTKSIFLNETDILRHPAVQEIINLYK
tara:strand:+ start:801 stop:1442 length:642 start_codon:yes stop_codon:yes gene_type:complete